ncbi:MAG TPA: DUF2809 domain-containing protein [Blastocatellia bacterium]|nr:DUF2809 domain-containing protein [Blastocatellia bacterium]
MKVGFCKKYAILSIGLFVVEIFIALFIHDRLVRPFVGDMLVVILIFTLCRTVIKANYFRLALCVLIFSFAVEIGQYFNLISILGLQHCRLARTVIGTTFDLHDLLAYSAGILLILIIGLLAKHYPGRQLVSSDPEAR